MAFRIQTGKMMFAIPLHRPYLFNFIRKMVLFHCLQLTSNHYIIHILTLSVPQDFHGCTKPFFIYAQNIMVNNLTAHNYVSLKDNPNNVYIKLDVLYENVK